MEGRGEILEGRGEKVEGRDMLFPDSGGRLGVWASRPHFRYSVISTLYPLPSTFQTSLIL